MFREHRHADEVASYVQAVRGRLDSPELRARVTAAEAEPDEAIQSLQAALSEQPLRGASEPGDKAFFARNAATSLLQTSLDEQTRRQQRGGLLGWLLRFIRRLLRLQKFGPLDPEWVTAVAAGMIARWTRGTHPFNEQAAEYESATGRLRVLVVGDWGSGLPRARRVAKRMAEKVQEARTQGVEVHVIHLGDVYYSGDPFEYTDRVLAPGRWPVEAGDAGVASWSLNGNHDMYSGGYGYFGTLLVDPRFRNQSSADGSPTSFFRIRTPSWDIVGLDTAWNTNWRFLGMSALLEDPQAAWLTALAADPERKLMLLSHHQFETAYDPEDIGPVLAHKLGPLIGSGRVSAWLWGHEHRCMGYAPAAVPVMRCVGNGGIPIQVAGPNDPPAPGTWQMRGTWRDRDGVWARFGYAVLDFDGAAVTASYYDDTDSTPVVTETF